MTKKTILITGATSGIGKQTLKELASQGHEMILVARNPEKIKQSIDEVKEYAPSANITHYVADFSDVDSVNEVAQEISRYHPIIDVLINNAGGLQIDEQKAKCGREKTLVVNHLSHVALTVSLLSNLKASEQGTVINVSSDSYRLPGYELNVSDFEGKYNWNKAYNRSKLAQIQFMHVLQDKLKDENIVITSISPGSAKTDIYRSLPKFIRWMISFTLKPVAQCITDIVDIANMEDSSMYAGQFVSKGQIKQVDEKFLSSAVLNEIWSMSTHGLRSPQDILCQ